MYIYMYVYIYIYIYVYIYVCIQLYTHILTHVSPDVKLYNIIQTKSNQTVLIMFFNLSKRFIGYLRDIHKYPTSQNANFHLSLPRKILNVPFVTVILQHFQNLYDKFMRHFFLFRLTYIFMRQIYFYDTK